MDDPQYKPLYQQAVNLQYKFHDFTVGISHPEVNTLRNEINQLVEDIEVKKNPHTIEDRIKTIQRQLIQSEHTGSPIMHYEHKDFLHDNYEQMRNNVRGLNNY